MFLLADLGQWVCGNFAGTTAKRLTTDGTSFGCFSKAWCPQAGVKIGRAVCIADAWGARL